MFNIFFIVFANPPINDKAFIIVFARTLRFEKRIFVLMACEYAIQGIMKSIDSDVDILNDFSLSLKFNICAQFLSRRWNIQAPNL